jgi:predicted MPP superfamily phosphohydrolase
MHVEFKEYSLQTEKMLESDKLTIAMISDLHLGTTMNAKKLEEYCTQINEKNPDVILLLGDIFDENTDKESMELACQAFGTLSSRYGTYYVFGNHDVNNYRPIVSLEKRDITDNLIKNKIKILDDESTMINNSFYLIGRSDISFFKNSKRKTISQLIEPLDTNKYMILLDHQPLELETAASLGIDLQLSGHTHSGQIWPIGLIAKVFHINELNYGNKKIENYNAIVTSGIGCWGYPLRLGSNSEIVIIQITNSEQSFQR